MTTLNPLCCVRDFVIMLFAAALHGDRRAEDELRELAIHDDRAADALVGLACTETVEGPCPADVAAIDQMIAAVLDAVGRAHRT